MLYKYKTNIINIEMFYEQIKGFETFFNKK